MVDDKGAPVKNRQMQALLTGPDGLGTALRTARGGLSMQQLADRITAVAENDPGVGRWGTSRVSKIEMGQQLPSELDIELWAKATGATAATRTRWQKLRIDAEAKRSLYRRRTASHDGSASAPGDLERVAALTRTVELTVIPELLQIEGYTRAVLTPTLDPDAIDEAVANLRTRQKALHSEKRFQFLIGEAALRTVRGDAAVMAGQLDRLATVASLANVTIGIIPLGVPLKGPALSAGFTLYDLDEAVISDGLEEHKYVGNSAAVLRERLDAAWEDAVQGRAARKLIIEAGDALNVD
ncbi:DUF5753 domain-containing protein [Actinoplanes sp. URMC 104]|uniref:DUF5753 domain-containing protein n=1 Tax=Actinoplanes sp. URMC 104 TaxID=3423409 RepID=UPI003F1AD761